MVFRTASSKDVPGLYVAGRKAGIELILSFD